MVDIYKLVCLLNRDICVFFYYITTISFNFCVFKTKEYTVPMQTYFCLLKNKTIPEKIHFICYKL